MRIVDQLARMLNIRNDQVEAVLNLVKEGATIPFIARYRKEHTGSLDEVVIAEIIAANGKLEKLAARKDFVLKAIGALGALTPKLRAQIEAAVSLSEVEDSYRPFKKKKRSRAQVAIDKGLLPLAKRMMRQENLDFWQEARKFVNTDLIDEEACLQGARDIVAQWIADDANTRKVLRKQFLQESTVVAKVITTKKKKEEAQRFRDYFSYEEKVSRIAAHRFLAIMRGKKEGYLRVQVRPEFEKVLARLSERVLRQRNKSTSHLQLAIEDSYNRLLIPSLEKEALQSLKERADTASVTVFSKNMRELLMAPAYGERASIGIDPGFRTGCKLVVVSRQGKLLHYETIFPFLSDRKERAERTILNLQQKHKIEAIAIGNGTAGKETFQFLKTLAWITKPDLVLVNESGASIYSASPIARKEFPDLDLTYRGAVSIARRLMDPLAELVKIDPKSVGVGQYQHDVNQALLRESLTQVVSSCVNTVGVELNTASPELLSYVSGLGPQLAQNIVDHREANGPFQSRNQLKKVKRLGPKAFEQAAGFLRIREPKNPLDASGIHPERYPLLEQISRDLNCSTLDLMKNKQERERVNWKRYQSQKVGMPTLMDIRSELEKPGRDPRGVFENTQFRDDVNSIEDLKTGMYLDGIITNVTNFGAFVDIGVHQDGLVHISQLANRFVSNPMDIVRVNQKIRVRVTEIDLQRNRIALSMKEQD